jgi:hypothetical protein
MENQRTFFFSQASFHTPGARPCLRFNPSRGDKPKTDQGRPFL